MSIDGPLGSLYHAGVSGKSKVIVGAKIHYFLTTGVNARALGRCYNSFPLKQACFPNAIQFLFQYRLDLLIHNLSFLISNFDSPLIKFSPIIQSHESKSLIR
jgi:hypothetical protein